MGSGSFLGLKPLGELLTAQPHQAPSLKKDYSCTSAPLWALVACSRAKFYLYPYLYILERQKFDLLSLVADMLYLTQYLF